MWCSARSGCHGSAVQILSCPSKTCWVGCRVTRKLWTGHGGTHSSDLFWQRGASHYTIQDICVNIRATMTTDSNQRRILGSPRCAGCTKMQHTCVSQDTIYTSPKHGLVGCMCYTLPMHATHARRMMHERAILCQAWTHATVHTYTLGAQRMDIRYTLLRHGCMGYIRYTLSKHGCMSYIRAQSMIHIHTHNH